MPAGRPGPFLVPRLLERARDDGLRRRSSRHHLRHRRDLLPYVARLGLRQADHIRGRRKRRRLRLRSFRPGRRTGPPGSSSGAPAPAVPGPRAVRAAAATSAPFSLGAPHMERKTPRTGEHDFSGRQPLLISTVESALLRYAKALQPAKNRKPRLGRKHSESHWTRILAQQTPGCALACKPQPRVCSSTVSSTGSVSVDPH